MKRPLTLSTIALSALMALAGPAVGQRPGESKAESKARAEARADAKADARGDSAKTSRSSHTATHRVVVENGKVVVDERTENGRVVPGGKGGGALGGSPLPIPADPAADFEEMVRKLREQVEREVQGLPPAGGSADPRRNPAPRMRDVVRDSDSAKARSTEKATDRSSDRSSDRAAEKRAAELPVRSRKVKAPATKTPPPKALPDTSAPPRSKTSKSTPPRMLPGSRRA